MGDLLKAWGQDPPCDSPCRSSSGAPVSQRTTNGRTRALPSLPLESIARTAITWRPRRGWRSTQRHDSFVPRTDLRRLWSTHSSMRTTRTLSRATARTVARRRSRERRDGDVILTCGRATSGEEVLLVPESVVVPVPVGGCDPGPGSDVVVDGPGSVVVVDGPGPVVVGPVVSTPGSVVAGGGGSGTVTLSDADVLTCPAASYAA